MTLANDIIYGKDVDFDIYLRQGESLDDIDEYGFTPLIECVISKRHDVAERLLKQGAMVDVTDVTGRTALHWATDFNDIPMCRLLLEQGANPNAYTLAGQPILVLPILRQETALKQLLYQYGGKIDFAQDFISTKLIGHRFELLGDTDILTTKDEYIEVDYEGFMLEFSVALIQDSLRRFRSSFSTRQYRAHFTAIDAIQDALAFSSSLLKLQHSANLTKEQWKLYEQASKRSFLILPAASRGHAMGFIRWHDWWAKIDRGENALSEGSVNIYKINQKDALTKEFIHSFIYKKQPRHFFHDEINKILKLVPAFQIPLTKQRSGNCSWANVQGMVLVAHALLNLQPERTQDFSRSIEFYNGWNSFDQDRALDELIQRFYHVNPKRKASIASMLGAILFQSLDYRKKEHILRAEKILSILTLTDYRYVLDAYINEYCVKRLTFRGNNLLKILDDCGVNPGVGVNFIATDLPSSD